MTPAPELKTSRSGSVLTLRLNRPERRNAMTPAMLSSLYKTIDDAAADPDPPRAMLLLSDGKVFCAGFDLDLCAADPEGGTMRALLTGLSETIRAMREAPFPTVVGVQGAAVAGGCALLGGADFVVADAGARFGYPVLKLGVSPSVTAPFLAESVGTGSCRRHLLEPELFSVDHALRIGLVDEIASDAGSVGPAARAAAERLAALPPDAVSATRSWLDRISGSAGLREPALAASLSRAGGGEERSRVRAAKKR